MRRAILGNTVILVLAFLYWFLVDYLYAKNFELYHPFEWLIKLTFLLFVLISFDFTSKACASLAPGTRRVHSLIFPAVLALIFFVVLYFFGLEFHLWVGQWLFA